MDVNEELKFLLLFFLLLFFFWGGGGLGRGGVGLGVRVDVNRLVKFL